MRSRSANAPPALRIAPLDPPRYEPLTPLKSPLVLLYKRENKVKMFLRERLRDAMDNVDKVCVTIVVVKSK